MGEIAACCGNRTGCLEIELIMEAPLLKVWRGFLILPKVWCNQSAAESASEQ